MAQPIGSPAWATVARSVWSCPGMPGLAVVQVGRFPAAVATAEPITLLLYRARPMVIVLTLSRMTRIAPTVIVN